MSQSATGANGPQSAPGFDNAPFQSGAALGRVTRDQCRIWVRCAELGEVRVDCRARDLADLPTRRACVEITGDAVKDRINVALLEQLQPGTAYRFKVTHSASGELLSEGCFETAPQRAEHTDDRFAISLLSCHQPFTDHGTIDPAALTMLRATRSCLHAHNTKLVLTVGDQMYTDSPKPLSLFNRDYFASLAPAGCAEVIDCSIEQSRDLIHARYKHFWNFDDWRRIHNEFACYPLLDDHEIVDNWGTDPKHAEPRWQAFKSAALSAYANYQASRVFGTDCHDRDHFDYAIEYGPVAFYVLDIRSNRTGGSDGRLFSDAQFESLRQFLATHKDLDVLGLAVSVPIIHLPVWMAWLSSWLTSEGSDFADRWSTGGHIRDRDAVLRLLREHQRQNPQQKLVLLSGDIHIASAQEIAWTDGTRPLTQLISSGITHGIGPLTSLACRSAIAANRQVVSSDGESLAAVRLLPGQANARQNPFGHRNMGMLELQRERPGDRYSLRFKTFGHIGEAPYLAFCSDWQ